MSLPSGHRYVGRQDFITLTGWVLYLTLIPMLGRRVWTPGGIVRDWAEAREGYVGNAHDYMPAWAKAVDWIRYRAESRKGLARCN